jgi:putative oxidoreductase
MISAFCIEPDRGDFRVSALPPSEDPPMPWRSNRILVLSGTAVLLAGVLHLVIPIGDWYRFFGAPERLARMAAAGKMYPVTVCLGIAAVLFVWAGYAFSGAGMIRRLPFLRGGLALIAGIFFLRGILLVPLAAVRPDLLPAICNSKGVDWFLILTSLVCIAIGVGYVAGAWHLKRA